MATPPFLKVPAIAITQPIGRFFLCSLPARVLTKVTFSIPASMTRTDSGVLERILGNQRRAREDRANAIGRYIDEIQSTFPNTVILSANTEAIDGGPEVLEPDDDEDDDAALPDYLGIKDGHEIPERHWRSQPLQVPGLPDDKSLYELIIPTDARIASIIDGQHRLKGFERVKVMSRLNMDIPCAVFIGLPRSYQANIFATININQKRVDKSLAYQLFGYDLAENEAMKWPPDMLGVFLARVLESADSSPFKGHIKLALLDEEQGAPVPELDTGNWFVSVACIVQGITRLVSTSPKRDASVLAQNRSSTRDQLPTDKSPLRAHFIKGKDKTITNVVTGFFTAAQKLLWKDQPAGTFITRTVGILALFDILRIGLERGRISLEKTETTALDLLAGAAGIDFSDDIFHASGAGRIRIRQVIEYATTLRPQFSEDEEPVPSNDEMAQVAERLQRDAVKRRQVLVAAARV